MLEGLECNSKPVNDVAFLASPKIAERDGGEAKA